MESLITLMGHENSVGDGQVRNEGDSGSLELQYATLGLQTNLHRLYPDAEVD